MSTPISAQGPAHNYNPQAKLESESKQGKASSGLTPTPALTKEKQRNEDVTAIMNRAGLIDRLDKFFANEPANGSDYGTYFQDLIDKNKHILSSNPSQDEYTGLTHKVYAIYRRSLVEKAYHEVETDIKDWTFKDKADWDSQQQAFKDFVWSYAKMVYTGAPAAAIRDAMREKFSEKLPKDFRVSIHAETPSEEEFYTPTKTD